MRRSVSNRQKKLRPFLSEQKIAQSLDHLKSLFQSEQNRHLFYEEVLKLRDQGVRGKVIATHLGVSDATISKWMRRIANHIPTPSTTPKHPESPIPEIKILEVVDQNRSQPCTQPKLFFHIDWLGFRLNFELV